MDDRERKIEQWFELAHHDLISAEYLTTLNEFPIEIICYHCQQSAEKNMKGFLALNNFVPPKTHDLEYIRELCFNFETRFDDIKKECVVLTEYSVELRYPMELQISTKDVYQALEYTKNIKHFIKNLRIQNKKD